MEALLTFGREYGWVALLVAWLLVNAGKVWPLDRLSVRFGGNE